MQSGWRKKKRQKEKEALAGGLAGSKLQETALVLKVVCFHQRAAVGHF